MKNKKSKSLQISATKKPEEKKVCSWCKEKILDSEDWAFDLCDSPFCEKCVDRGYIFNQGKKPELKKEKEYKRKTTFQTSEKSNLPKINKWKDPLFLKKYWNSRYANDPKRHTLCECGNPKRTSSRFCLICHNKKMVRVSPYIRDCQGRFTKKTKNEKKTEIQR